MCAFRFWIHEKYYTLHKAISICSDIVNLHVNKSVTCESPYGNVQIMATSSIVISYYANLQIEIIELMGVDTKRVKRRVLLWRLSFRASIHYEVTVLLVSGVPL